MMPLMILLRATKGALHALLTVFRGARYLGLYEFARGFVELFCSLRTYGITSFAAFGRFRLVIL